MARKPCSKAGCPNLVPKGTSRCDPCNTKADKARGTAAQRGYDNTHRTVFREGVLARDPICVSCYNARSTVADHHPLDRRELVARGMNPNDPQHGRGLCKTCHDKHTAATQPGGWNQRD